MVTEIRGALNAIAGGKARHLQNQSWLSRDDLIDRSANTRFSLSWTVNASTVFTFCAPRAPMRLAKLTHNA